MAATEHNENFRVALLQLLSGQTQEENMDKGMRKYLRMVREDKQE